MLQTTKRTSALIAGTLLLCAVPEATRGQRASEKASLLQEIAGATLTIEYSRPTARGRPKLFGGVVHWGEIWTPGANWATTLEVSRDFTLNGQAVPQGKYSMWMVPAETGDWTVFLNKNPKRFHTQRPKDTSEDLVRLSVKPETGKFMETLTFYYPVVKRDGATLNMHWGETVIPLQFGLGEAKSVPLTAEQISQFVGDYKHVTTPMDGGLPRNRDFTVFMKDGFLMGKYVPNPGGAEFQFVHAGGGRFEVVQFNNGVRGEQFPGQIVFTVTDGVTRFKLGDGLWNAERVK